VGDVDVALHTVVDHGRDKGVCDVVDVMAKSALASECKEHTSVFLTPN
jgi:hypothetical protein